jgi:hypothetical protein
VPCFALLAVPNLARNNNVPITIPLLVFGLFSATTFLLGVSFLSQSGSNRSFLLCAFGILVLMFIIGLVSPIVESKNLGSVVSGKWLAASVKSDVADIEKLRIVGYRRDIQYALNFYLHKEIPEWKDSPVHDGYVLAKSADCFTLTTDDCKDLWETRDWAPGGGLLRITPKNSPDGLGGSGRQPQ